MASIEAVRHSYDEAVLDAHAAHLRAEGLTFRQIADEMGCSVAGAHKRVMRAYGRMPGPDATAERNRMLRELDDAAVAVYGVLESAHLAISAKGVVTITVNGQEIPVPDDHPVLEAVDRLLRIQERRAKLLGTDAPSKRSVEVVTKDALVAEMERMTQEMADGAGGAG